MPRQLTSIFLLHNCQKGSRVYFLKYLHIILLSQFLPFPPLGGPGFFPTFSAARGRDPVAASLMENLLIKNAGKKCDFGNEPIELAEFLHVFRLEQANQQSLLAFFRIFS